MRRIYKYSLEVIPIQEVHTEGAPRVLSVHEQGGARPLLWIEGDPDGGATITVYTALTGKVFDIPPDARFIGTYFLNNKTFVGHIYVKGG